MSEDKKSKQDPTHIQQMTFDEDKWAVRTHIVDTEMSMELSADDGDSVIAEPTRLVASAIGCDASDNNSDVIPAMDCSKLREVHCSVEGTGRVNILVSPVDSGDFFYKIGGEGDILKVCARRIKVQSFDVVGNVHLVGRS